MYSHFYQLSESPFNLTPDPKFQYVNESTREALASILYGIKSRKGFITLIGEAGTGKTTLLKRVLDEIEGETVAVFVFNPGVSFDELLEYICTELGVATDGRRRLTLLERLNRYLLKQLTEGRNVVVMIDEAQTMEDSVLEELRLLSNLETSKEKILQILLSGQPELDEKLKRPGLRQLRQRVGVRATLKPMRADEIGAYVATRLRSAGSPRADLFTQSALSGAWRAAQGIPRVVNVICDNAMMIAFAEGRDRITAGVMRTAIRDLNGDNRFQAGLAALRGWFAQPWVRYATASVLAVALALPLTMRLIADRRPATAAEGVAVAAGGAQPAAAAPAPAPQALAPVAQPATAAASQQALGDPTAGTSVSAPLRGVPASGGAVAAGAEGPAEGEVSGTMADSIRRAELLAGSTAARLFDKRQREAEAARKQAAAKAGAVAAPPVVAMRSEEAARDMANKVFARQPVEEKKESGAEETAAVVPAGQAGGATSPEAEAFLEADTPFAADPLAGDLESVAELSEAGMEALAPEGLTGPRLASPRLGEAIVGRLVKVGRGDTVWAVALQYYGKVDSAILTQIFQSNAAIVDPRRLEVGSYIYLPFLSAEQMVRSSSAGGYRVLLAETPDADTLARVAQWVDQVLPGTEFARETKGKGHPVELLYAVGYPARDQALEVARAVRARYAAERGKVAATDLVGGG